MILFLYEFFFFNDASQDTIKFNAMFVRHSSQKECLTRNKETCISNHTNRQMQASKFILYSYEATLFFAFTIQFLKVNYIFTTSII